jgi:flagellar hook-length control protein FliK
MNIESIGIRNGVAQGQAQGAKSAGDPLAALFAEFLGLADALVAGGTAKAKQADEPSAEQQQLMAMAGLPILPAAAQGTTPAQQQGTTHETAAAGAAAGGKAVAAAAVAAMPGAALPIQVPKEGAGAPANGKATPAADGKLAVAADAKAAPAAAPDGKPESKPGDAAKPTATATLPPLAVSLAPNVTLAAPKTAAPAGAEKAKPAASSGSAAKSTAPVSVTVEKAPAQPAGEARRAEEPAAIAAAAPAPSKDDPAATPAKPELTATAPAPTSPPPQAAQGPVDKAAPPPPQAAAVPLHDATQQVVHRVEKAVEHGEDRIRIELKPASLGGVEVHLHIADDGRVNAVVRADRADTLSLLQSDARGLEQALKDAGLRPDAGSLSFNLRQGEGQAGHQPDARGQRRRGNSERAVFAIEAVGAEPPSVRDLPGGLDIRI